MKLIDAYWVWARHRFAPNKLQTVQTTTPPRILHQNTRLQPSATGRRKMPSAS